MFEFIFIVLFEEGFLWSDQEVDKYTKYRKEENTKYPNNMHKNIGSSVRNILNNPDDKRYPYKSEIHCYQFDNRCKTLGICEIKMCKVVHIRGG